MGKTIVRVLTVCVATVSIIFAAGCSGDPITVEASPPSTQAAPSQPDMPELPPDYDRLETLAQMDIDDATLMSLANSQLELEAMWPSDGAETGALAYAPLGDLCYIVFMGTGTLASDSTVRAELRWRYADDLPLVVTGTGTPLEVVSVVTSNDNDDTVNICFYEVDTQEPFEV